MKVTLGRLPRGLVSWAMRTMASLVLLTSLLNVGRANAQSPSDVRATKLAEAGSLAASMGEYGYAIRAFHEAYAYSRRAEWLFAEAEAHRRRHALDAGGADLEAAILGYRRYLVEAPTGDRADASKRTLARLEPLLGNNAVDRATGDAEERATRLAVTSPIRGASARIDRGATVPLPAFVELEAGKHVVTVLAKGYVDRKVPVELRGGSVDAEDVDLDPKPARLDVREPIGADVYVDGLPVGVAPFAKPLDVDPGSHVVTVSMTGHRTNVRRVSIERGQTETVAVDLAVTRQRTVASILIGTGGASLAAGIGLGVAAVVRDRAAQDISGPRGQPLGADEQARYDDIVAQRDRLRVGAAIAGGAGLGVAVVGGLLYAIDAPSAPRGSDAKRSGWLDLRIVPAAPDTDIGVSAVVRF